MESLVYENTVITGHAIYPVCGTTLHEVSRKDYPKDSFFDPRIACLDMDLYETGTCRGNRRATVDAVIGVKKHLRGNRYSIPYLMMVELRMDYRNPKNLSATSLLAKVEHTKDLLGADQPLYDSIFFVFRNDVIESARYWFRNTCRENSALRHFEALSTGEFDKYVKDRYPYIYETDLEALGIQLAGLIRNNDVNGFLQAVEDHAKKACDYRQIKYNLDEYRGIAAILKKQWMAFRSASCITLTDNEELAAEILEEDYPGIFGEE